MHERLLIGLGIIIGLGILLQWVSKMIKIPAIITLLIGGILVGPVWGLVDPIEIFGDTLFPLVTIGVGLLLFRGGFELKIRNIQPSAKEAVWRLVTLGVIITLLIGALIILVIFNLTPMLALLLAAILVVSGPTVVGPVLNFARPREPVDHVLMWESILIDPIGASIAVAILSVITGLPFNPILELVITLGSGVLIGLLAAIAYVICERSGRVPPNLSPLIAMMFAIIAIVSAEMIFTEAGLFAAVAMGLALGNQKSTPAIGVRQFNETLEPLIIGILFILLAALVNLAELAKYILPALGLVAVYVLLVRPLVALIATHGLNFSLSQRIFIGALAPRGIVAAATSSFFAISLFNAGVSFPELVPVVFTVIMGTVLIYGISAPILSRRMNIAMPGRDMVALVGDQPWILDLAEVLHKLGVKLILIAPGKYKFQKYYKDGKSPYLIYTGSLNELRNEEIVDQACEFKYQIKWLIIAIDNPDLVRITLDTFIPDIGYTNLIIFGRERSLQDEIVHSKSSIDILSQTPFGLFGKNIDELLDILEAGGTFKVLNAKEQSPAGGVSPGCRSFLRVNSDGTLAVPASDEKLKEGESNIMICPGRELKN